MVICPQCAKLVDEKASANCPHCFTALTAAGTQAGAPQPGQAPPGQSYPGAPGQPPPQQSYAPQLSRTGGTRVSLTGEVIEDSPSSAPPSYVGGGAPTSIARPTGPNASRAASRTEAPAKSGGGGMIVGILLAIVLAGGLGAAGWFFLMPHSNPKTVVQQFNTAIGAQDWKTAYNLTLLDADEKTKFPDAGTFATTMTEEMQKLHNNPMTASLGDSITKAYQTAQVEEPVIEGDTASVPVKMTISISIMGQNQDRTLDHKVKLRKDGRIWKMDGLTRAVPTSMGGMQ